MYCHPKERRKDPKEVTQMSMDFNNPVAIKRKKRIHNQDKKFPISSLQFQSDLLKLHLCSTSSSSSSGQERLMVGGGIYTSHTHETGIETHAARIKLRKRSQRDDARRIWRRKNHKDKENIQQGL
jgi:hypothetical protein